MHSRWELGSFASLKELVENPWVPVLPWDTNASLVAADLETLVSQVLSEFPYNTGFADGLFVMTTATDHTTTLTVPP